MMRDCSRCSGLASRLFTMVWGDSPREKALREYYLLSQGTKTCLMVPTLVGGDVKGFISIRHGDRGRVSP